MLINKNSRETEQSYFNASCENTLDGRKLAPPGMYKTLSIMGYSPYIHHTGSTGAGFLPSAVWNKSRLSSLAVSSSYFFTSRLIKTLPVPPQVPSLDPRFTEMSAFACSFAFSTLLSGLHQVRWMVVNGIFIWDSRIVAYQLGFITSLL